MNNQRRRALRRIYDIIEKNDYTEDNFREFYKQRSSEIYSVQSEEEIAFDNMPENLQGSMRGMESEEAIEHLSEAVDLCDEIVEMKEFDYDKIIDLEEKITDELDDVLYY